MNMVSKWCSWNCFYPSVGSWHIFVLVCFSESMCMCRERRCILLPSVIFSILIHHQDINESHHQSHECHFHALILTQELILYSNTPALWITSLIQMVHIGQRTLVLSLKSTSILSFQITAPIWWTMFPSRFYHDSNWPTIPQGRHASNRELNHRERKWFGNCLLYSLCYHGVSSMASKMENINLCQYL